MEVSGKRGKQQNINVCNPCKGRGTFKHSDGYCGECEEYMCQSCFDTHKEWKLNRRHRFTDPTKRAEKRENIEYLEKCKKHLNELVKFYCPHHKKVGCGDCMVLDHKACKIEYIPDIASTFKDSGDFKELSDCVKVCQDEVNEMCDSIKEHKRHIRETHESFVNNVDMFKEEIIAHVNKMTNAMLKQGKDKMTSDMKKMLKLEEESKTLMNELSRLMETIDAHVDKPNKLFVNSITQKALLEQLNHQLDSLKSQNMIEKYEFRRDGGMERLVKECKQLGLLQTIGRGMFSLFCTILC